jgi:hypothetical protein
MFDSYHASIKIDALPLNFVGYLFDSGERCPMGFQELHLFR